MIHHEADAEIADYLAGAVVDARLELVSWLGPDRLATGMRARAGKIVWDSTDRRGRLDVDVPVADAVLHPRHPVGNLGQVLEARWAWPELGVSVPCGRWLIAEPAGRTEQLWQVAADPEGPARLARAQWWHPGERVLTGSMVTQATAMLAEARVGWSPSGAFSDHGAPATEATSGTSILTSLQAVLDHADVQMRAARHGSGVVLSRRYSQVSRPDWSWTEGEGHVQRVTGSHETREIPNRVTVWYEQDSDGVRTTKGWSEPLFSGPRRWDGPYGRVPHVVRLDGPATDAAIKTQSRQMLRRFQELAATVRVEMRADPRVEPGDSAHIISGRNGTDCVARVTSVALDAGTGLAVVEGAVLSGDIAGTPTPTWSIPGSGGGGGGDNPTPEPVLLGFGLSAFGTQPFGS